jgi:hypothetical protein
VEDFIIEKFCEIDLTPSLDTDFNLEDITKFDNDKKIAYEMTEELQPLQAVVSSIEDFNEQLIFNDDLDEYDLRPGDEILRDFELEIGSKKCPRFSCSNHIFFMPKKNDKRYNI